MAEKARKLLNELTVGPEGKGEEGTVYLREMNGVSLMLEIAEFLEVNEDISLRTATFRMELSAHAWIQRRAERDSVANEAERGNLILGRAATIGSSVSNSRFKTAEECLKKLEGDVKKRSVDTDEITKLTGIQYCAKVMQVKWANFFLCLIEFSSKNCAKIRKKI